MPQMAPLSWLLMMGYAFMFFMIFNFLNYYQFNYKIQNLSCVKLKEKIINLKNWQW